MKTLILVTSYHHHNTQKVAQAMAEKISADVVDIISTPLDQIDIASYDLIGFGSGIYAGKFHAKLLKFIDSLPQQTAKPAFVFSTSTAQRKLYVNNPKQLLEEKGFKVLGTFQCKGFDSYGPLGIIGGIDKKRPNERDLKRAQEFIANISQQA